MDSIQKEYITYNGIENTLPEPHRLVHIVDQDGYEFKGRRSKYKDNLWLTANFVFLSVIEVNDRWCYIE